MLNFYNFANDSHTVVRNADLYWVDQPSAVIIEKTALGADIG